MMSGSDSSSAMRGAIRGVLNGLFGRIDVSSLGRTVGRLFGLSVAEATRVVEHRNWTRGGGGVR